MLEQINKTLRLRLNGRISKCQIQVCVATSQTTSGVNDTAVYEYFVQQCCCTCNATQAASRLHLHVQGSSSKARPDAQALLLQALLCLCWQG